MLTSLGTREELAIVVAKSPKKTMEGITQSRVLAAWERREMQTVRRVCKLIPCPVLDFFLEEREY